MTETKPCRSLLLGVYLALSGRAAPFAATTLRRRRAAGKEHAERIGERMGEASLPRPDGPVAWFHAASVGEAVSLLEMLRRLCDTRPDLTCLVTSGTLTSAELLADRLPDRCIHQFVPLDVLPWVRRFLDHWKPSVAVWTESELWPAMIWETHRRGIPMLLINARISDRTYRRWRGLPGMARAILERFDRVLAQDDLAEVQLAALGADPDSLEVTGSLKEGAAPLPCDDAERVRLTRAFAGRELWLAASTHEGEEETVVSAHLSVLRSHHRLTLILAPRHPDRGDGIAAMLRQRGLTVQQRSAGDMPNSETDVYLADTLGEMGLWYRLSPVSFIGGSLIDIGGHNPYEPALLGSAVLHGPHVRNFRDAYAKLTAAGAAVEVTGVDGLVRALDETLAPDRAAAMAAAGWQTCSESAEVTDRVIEAVVAALDRGQ